MSEIENLNTDAFIGRDMGTVTLLKLIGKGAAGAVFLAFQRTLKRQVAVKILPKSDRTTEASRELFRQEAEIVAILSHPYIIPIFEMGEEDDCYYQVMQVVKGEDLNSRIKKRQLNPIPHKRVLPLTEALTITRQVLDGLGYAHDEGVVHQDIKPLNILIEEKQNRPLIADFGIAKIHQHEVRQEGTIVGSPLYMAPEYILTHTTDSRSDIYSVGVMFFQTLVGNLPLTETHPMRLIQKKIEDHDHLFGGRPSELSPHVDANLEAIVYKAIAPEPERRYQTCSQFKEALENYGRSA
ncbi:MAG: protein kinase [Chitinivibrionales bacterium]|nr:protein kinase [Chitinivibrionales bacterium]